MDHEDDVFYSPAMSVPEEDEMVPAFESLTEAHNRFRVLWSSPDDGKQQKEYLKRMGSTVWEMCTKVNDAQSEEAYHQVAMMGLLVRLLEFHNRTALLETMHKALCSMDDVFLGKEHASFVSVDTMEDMIQHLRGRLYKLAGPSKKRMRWTEYRIDTRVYPIVVCLVAQIVCMRRSTAAWHSTKETVQQLMLDGGFEMDSDCIQAGLAMFGLHVLKFRTVSVSGLAASSVLALLETRG